MNSQPIGAVLSTIGDYLGLDSISLMNEAMLDEIGGYHSDPAQSKFHMGSIWGVEGQIIYALIRLLRPKRVLEVGTYYGCSTRHIIAALEANREDYGDSVEFVAVDNLVGGVAARIDCDFLTMINMDAIDYLISKGKEFDFLFEDSKHEAPFITELYQHCLPLGSPGAVMVSHDAAHFAVGEAVLKGIQEAGVEPIVVLPAPSDCGLSIYRKYSQKWEQWEKPSLADEPESQGVRYTLDELHSMTKAELIQEIEALAIDPNGIEGSGAGGNILKEDLVEAMIQALKL